MFSKEFRRFILLFLLSFEAFASFTTAERLYGKSSAGFAGYKNVITELVSDGYYFSVLPWVKDYIYKSEGNLPREMESAIDAISIYTGTRIFNTLPEKILKRSSSSTIRYVLAKRLLLDEKHLEAIAELNRVSGDDTNYPFVLNLRASIKSSIGEYDSAINDFYECISISNQKSTEEDLKAFAYQLNLNKELCLAGLGRSKFGKKSYAEADLLYLDISKDSYIWPSILLEEAWNSYYLKNYNRTLGKLVSYQAPVFDFIVNPEIEVLKALSYLKLCLYDDAKNVVDVFYQNNEKMVDELNQFLERNKKDYRYFYQILVDHESGKSMPHFFLEKMIYSVRKDPTVLSVKNSLGNALKELKKIQNQQRSNLKVNLLRNLRIVSDDYKQLLGFYVRQSLKNKLNEYNRSFQGMSYIKLEVLAQRKEALYQRADFSKKKRGDVRYLERNEKQYFWNFNGEFWADELGDYVFALRSECSG
jgi:tetratricopeptide (TPR) repeat protein